MTATLTITTDGKRHRATIRDEAGQVIGQAIDAQPAEASKRARWQALRWCEDRGKQLTITKGQP